MVKQGITEQMEVETYGNDLPPITHCYVHPRTGDVTIVLEEAWTLSFLGPSVQPNDSPTAQPVTNIVLKRKKA